MGSYRNRAPQYIICSRPHKMKEDCYGVANYIKRKEKICVHVIAKCANCGGNYTTNSPQFVSRHKTDLKVRKRKCNDVVT